MASQSLPDLSSMTTSQAILSLASVWPTPTNEQALAVLDGLPQWASAEEAIAAGLPEQTARAYLAPAGVIPRMRLLASQWTKPGDKFADASSAWWGQAYKYNLWAAVSRYATDVDAVGEHHVVVDEEIARGDAAALSHAIATVNDVDIPPVMEAPCPRWLIPPKPGMLPTPNPECLRRELEKNKDKLAPLLPKPREKDWAGLVVVVLLGYYLARRGGLL